MLDQDTELDLIIAKINNDLSKYQNDRLTRFVNRVRLFEWLLFIIILHNLYLILVMRDIRYDVIALQAGNMKDFILFP